jgi:hypothetical protein
VVSKKSAIRPWRTRDQASTDFATLTMFSAVKPK